SRERSFSPGRGQCRRMLVCSPERSPRRYSTPQLVRHNSPGTVGDGREQSILRAFELDQLPSELLEEYEPPAFHDIPADASFEEVMCIMATPPSKAPTAAQSMDHLRAEVAHVIEMDSLRKRTAAAMSESVAPSVVCPVKAAPEEVITVPPHPKDPKDVEALIKRARAIAKLKAIEEAKAAAAEAAAPPPPPKKVAKAAPVSKRAPAQKPAAAKPQQKVPQKAPPKAPQRPPPKVPQKAPPKAVQKAPPKAVQKPPPKVAPKVPPKVVPKVAPKAPPKVPTKAPPKVPTKAPPKVPTKAPPKVPQKAPPKAVQKAPPKVPQKAPPKVPQKAPPKVPQKAPPKTVSKAPPKPPPKTVQRPPPTKTSTQRPQTAPQRGVQKPTTAKGPALKVPKPGMKTKGPTPQHPPGYVPPEYAKAVLRTRKLAGIKTVAPKKKTPTPQIVVCPPESSTITPVDAPEPLVIEATYESVMRRAAALRDRLGLSKQALEAQLAPSRKRLSPYLRDEDEVEVEPEEDLEDELDEFETLEELYNATASESLLEPDEAAVSVLQDRIAALQQELLPSPPSPIFEVPSILRYQDVGRRREYLAAAAARAAYMRRAEMEEEDEEDEEYEEEEEYEDEGDVYPIPICVIPPTPQQQVPQRPLRARSIFDSPTDYPTGEGFDNRLLEALEPPEFAVGDVSPYAFSREAYEDFLCGDPTKGDFSRLDFSQGQESPQIRPTLQGHPPRRKPRKKSKKFDDRILEGLEQPEFSVSSVSPYAFSKEAYDAYLSGSDSLDGEELERIDFVKYDRLITPPSFVDSPEKSSTPSKFNQAFVDEADLESSVEEEEAEEDLLADISIPEYDADVSMEEPHVGDVTPPDLCDLSISDTELALEPDYPDRLEAEVAVSPKQQGILTTMVNAIVDRVRNIFSPKDDQLEIGEEDEVNLDVSLPNLFETTPPPKAPTPEPVPIVCEPTQTSAKRISPEGPIRIPPHPKDPKDYQSIVRRAQAIQKIKAKEAAEAAAAAPPPPPPAAKTKKGKKEIKSTIPKRGPPPVKKPPPGKKAAPPGKKGPQPKKKKQEEEKKVYPPGEYSPSDVRAVARARTLAGFKHYSDLLNPERVAKEKAAQAAREAEMARIELLPPVIRMRKKIELLKDRLPPPGAEIMPRPSIDLLGRLEAIRASLPEDKPKKKWRPTGRLRVDRRIKKPDRIFRKEHGRILIPTKHTQKKKGWKKLDVMSPIEEASPPPPQQFIQFSPLRPEEGRKRLDYIREQAAKRAADIQRATEEAEGSIPHLFEDSREYGSPELEMGPIVNLLSPRTEETRRDKLVTTVGPHGGPETLREEVTETSVIENGEVRTSTRKVTTKTDEYGNVTRHVQEGTGQTGEEEAMPDLEDVEPPDFLDVSDIPPPQDPSIPTPGEIIDRIRANVRQKLQEAIPDVHESPVPTSPGEIDLPEDITDDDLYETIMELEGSSPEVASSPQRILSPIIKDDRLYALGERPPPTPPPPVVCPPSPKVTPPPPEPVRPRTPSPPPRPKSPEQIVVPAHPKDPKDYKSIVRRAQAIQKLKKQQEALLAKLAPPPPEEPAAAKATKGKAKKGGRVPISRWVAPPPKDKQKRKHKRIVLKKRAPKVSPKKASPVKEVEDDEDREIPDEPPELSQDYRHAVARARLLHGLQNRTAALNPEVAAKIAAQKAAEEAARAAYEALPENEKIKVRMERLRRLPPEQRRVQASAEVIGTIAAIRANMPPIEEVLRQPSPPPPCPSPPREVVPPSPRTPSAAHIPRYSAHAPHRVRARSPSPSPSPTEADKSLDDFEYMEQFMGAKPPTPEVCVPVQPEDLDASIQLPDISLLRPYISPTEQRSPSPVRPRPPSPGRSPASRKSSPRDFLDLSLAEFENLEEEAAMNLSLDEFEALEEEAQRVDLSSLHEAEDPQLYDYTTPTRGERHWGRNLAELFPRSPRDAIAEISDSMGVTEIETSPVLLPPRPRTPPVPWVAAPSMRQLAQQGFFEDQEYLEDEEEIVRPHISPRPGAPPGSIYYDPMEGFTAEPEEVVLDTSLLMPETPPKTLKEKLERLKRSTERRPISPTYAAAAVSPTTPPLEFSPVQLISPSGAPCIVPARTSPISGEGQLLIDVDAPQRRSVRHLRDLEDLPFYGIEYEDEPELQDVSFERPMTPPPRPEDIVAQIQSRVRNLRGQARRSPTKSPPMLPMPEEIPDEELMELSAPSFSATPPRTPSPRTKVRSPRLSLPMAWGEVRPPTPKTPSPRRPSPVRVPTPTPPRPPTPQKIPTPVCIPEEEGPIVIPAHPEDPKDYAAMIRRAQAIYKLKKQEEAEEAAKAPPPEPPKKKGRVPISRWVAPPPKKKPKKPRKKLVMRKRVKPEEKKVEPPPPPPEEEEEDREIPAEPPPLDQDYRDAVARARLLHGLKNRTAALNPKVAAKLAARKAAEEAAAAEFAALPEHEKIKVRMERLRKKPRRRPAAKPTMEQLAFLEAMKQVGGYQLTPPSPPKPPTPRISPAARRVQTPPRLSLSPQRRLQDQDELADFEAQEEDIDFQMMEAEAAMEAEGQIQELICPPAASEDNAVLQQRIANLEELLEREEMPEEGDVSLAEFEALEAVEAPAAVCPPPADVGELDMRQVIADLQSEQLRTPPRIDPRERYRQLLAQRQKTPPSPTLSPIQEPEIHYSPITLPSPSKGIIEKRAEKTTTQVTMSGDNTIQEQLIEKSEIVNGELQHVTTHVTTTTDAQGNVRCQINESKRIAARDPSAELEELPDIEDVDEPSFLDTTPISPMERPRPRDIIEKVKKQVKERYVPHVPTGQLIELRTPPRELPLPGDITQEELLEYSFAELEAETPDEEESPARTPARALDLSIPHVFEATPPTPTPPPKPVSPLRHRIPSPEGPIEIPPHPVDPKDYRAICRRARKIQEFRAKEEEELRAAEEAAAAAAAAEAAKPKKKVRVPISRWTAPPPKKPKKRKKLVMKKRGEAAQPKAAPPPEEEYPDEPPPLPEHFAEEVARARMLAGIKKKTPPHSPIKDFSTLQSRLAALREKGVVPKAQPSLASAAYLNAIKRAMTVRQQVGPSVEGAEYETPKSRYQRILAERAAVPPPAEESPIRTPPREDIPYIPVRFVSPRVQGDLLAIPEVDEDYALDMSALEDLEELAELQEPSLVDISQYIPGEEEDIDITPPSTPPPQPAEIISRIREQYQHVIQRPESPQVSPTQLEFPEDLPEEELLELSGISLAASPPRVESPVRSPDISFPRYFERTPPPKLPTPPARRSVSPGRRSPKSGRVKTPEGPLQIPPHPQDPTDVAAMIRRARMIQKLQAKEAAEKPVEEKPKKKVREPISRRTAPPPKREPKPHKKGRLFRPLKLKKKAPAAPAPAPPSPREIPKEPPKLPEDYVSVVNRARKLAGLKTGVALPQAERPPADYASIMERITALRAAKQEMQMEPTARELTTRQHLKNRQQRQERKRLLQELERIRAQQGYQEPIELAPVRTPPPAAERLRAIKERTPPKILEGPCSPVKTPEQIDMPAYRPIMLPPTPPCLFLQNVEVPEVADLSVCEFVEDDYDTTIEESEIEDYQFQVAEAEAAQAAISDSEYEAASEIQIQSDFDMAKRLQNLEYQLIDELADEEDLEFQMIELAAAAEAEAAAAEAEAAAAEERRAANRIEILENVLLAPPRTQCAQGFTNTQAVDVRSLIQVAENILMAPPTGYSPPTTSRAARERIQLEQRLRNLQQHLQQCEQTAAAQYMSSAASEYDDSVDEFEALENECR
ncbi:hypothetical protein DOY81_005270, partial [Sarcophaga bullata]